MYTNYQTRGVATRKQTPLACETTCTIGPLTLTFPRESTIVTPPTIDTTKKYIHVGGARKQYLLNKNWDVRNTSRMLAKGNKIIFKRETNCNRQIPGIPGPKLRSNPLPPWTGPSKPGKPVVHDEKNLRFIERVSTADSPQDGHFLHFVKDSIAEQQIHRFVYDAFLTDEQNAPLLAKYREWIKKPITDCPTVIPLVKRDTLMDLTVDDEFDEEPVLEIEPVVKLTCPPMFFGCGDVTEDDKPDDCNCVVEPVWHVAQMFRTPPTSPPNSIEMQPLGNNVAFLEPIVDESELYPPVEPPVGFFSNLKAMPETMNSAFRSVTTESQKIRQAIETVKERVEDVSEKASDLMSHIKRVMEKLPAIGTLQDYARVAGTVYNLIYDAINYDKYDLATLIIKTAHSFNELVAFFLPFIKPSTPVHHVAQAYTQRGLLTMFFGNNAPLVEIGRTMNAFAQMRNGVKTVREFAAWVLQYLPESLQDLVRAYFPDAREFNERFKKFCNVLMTQFAKMEMREGVERDVAEYLRDEVIYFNPILTVQTDENRDLCITFGKLRALANRVYVYSDQYAKHHAPRQCPFSVVVHGGTRVGKSVLLLKLARDLQRIEEIDGRTSYVRIAGTDHWDGFTDDVYATIFDDWLQNTDYDDVSEFFSLVTKQHFIVPMASLVDPLVGIKGTLNLSRIILAATNLENKQATATKINCPDALFARVGVRARVTRVADYDPIAYSHLRFQVYHKTERVNLSGRAMSTQPLDDVLSEEILDYAGFLKYVALAMRDHYAQQEAIDEVETRADLIEEVRAMYRVKPVVNNNSDVAARRLENTLYRAQSLGCVAKFVGKQLLSPLVMCGLVNLGMNVGDVLGKMYVKWCEAQYTLPSMAAIAIAGTMGIAVAASTWYFMSFSREEVLDKLDYQIEAVRYFFTGRTENLRVLLDAGVETRDSILEKLAALEKVDKKHPEYLKVKRELSLIAQSRTEHDRAPPRARVVGQRLENFYQRELNELFCREQTEERDESIRRVCANILGGLVPQSRSDPSGVPRRQVVGQAVTDHPKMQTIHFGNQQRLNALFQREQSAERCDELRESRYADMLAEDRKFPNVADPHVTQEEIDELFFRVAHKAEGLVDQQAVRDIAVARKCILPVGLMLLDETTSFMGALHPVGSVNAIPISRTDVLLPKHFLIGNDGKMVRNTKGKTYKLVFRCNGVNKEVLFDEKRVKMLIDSTGNASIDAVIFSVAGSTMSQLHSMLEMFVRERDLGVILKGTFATMVGYTWQQGQPNLYERTFQISPMRQHIPYMVGSHTMILQKGYSYAVPTNAGECGCPGIVHLPSVVGKIAFIHTLGHVQDLDSAGTTVTYELLQRHLLGASQASVKDLPVTFKSTAISQRIAHEARNLTIEVLGIVDKAPHVNRQTTFVPTPLLDVLREEVKVPSQKRIDCGEDPLLVGACLYGSDLLDLDLSFKPQVMKYLLSKYRDQPARVYDAAQAVNAQGGMDRLNLHTSAGYPYNCEGKNKTHFFEPDLLGGLVYKSTDYQQSVQLYIDSWRTGVTPVIWTMSLKDELIKPGKLARVFTFPGLEYTIACRAYFGAWIDMMHSTVGQHFCYVGINPESFQWSAMTYKLLGVSPFGLDADAPNWDKTLIGGLLWWAVDSVNLWYARNDPAWTVADDEARTNLIHELIFAHILVGDLLIKTNKGMKSGHVLTALFNSVTNMIMHLIWFLVSVPINLRDTAFYDECVATAVYGDDALDSIKTELLEHLNRNTMMTAYNRYCGMSITGAQKGEGLIPYEPVLNLTFLKRGFRQDGLVYKPTLDLKSMYSMLCHVRVSKHVSLEDQLLVNVRTFVAFAYFYGPDYYARTVQFLRKFFPSYVFPAYSYYDDMFNFGTFEFSILQ